MHKRPPVPKFSEECKTPEPQRTLNEDVQETIYTMGLGCDVEKRAMTLLQTIRLPHNKAVVTGVVYYCLMDLKKPVPQMDKKVEQVVKYLDAHQSTLINNLCAKLGLNARIIKVCNTLLRQLTKLNCKLTPQLQNAIAVKIAADIIFCKQGGINTKYLCYHARISAESLKNAIKRIEPFSQSIVEELFEYYNTNPL